jgi:hypothetical protein
MIFGLGWRAFFISILVAIALTAILRLSGCNAVIL